MPRSSRSIRISAATGIISTLAALSTGCSGSTGASGPTSAQPNTVSVSVTEPTSARTAEAPAAPSAALPADVEQAARAFTTAYAEHDARDGKDSSFADAGARAAQLASGDLVAVLAQKRPSQDATWSALRAAQARQSVAITSATVPDGAPAPTRSTALVRVGYTLTTTPASGSERRSGEQIALRLERTSLGWRVTALPWA
ncbi:hypothetical protein [Streptomyces goshikiensis]|uniref:hypothetical protein n=1 Tax=Streptomyces goshikiensis TaxID=1942 RepID=UPI003648B768